LSTKKKSNWADIVKLSEQKEPVKEEVIKKPVSPEKPKEVEAPKLLSPRPPSPEHIQSQPSPKPKAPISTPKQQFTSPRLEQEPPQKSPIQIPDTHLPPGLGQGRPARKMQEASVVMPRDAMLSSTGAGVQFGSFKAEAEKQPSPDRIEEPLQYKSQPKPTEHSAAPGLNAHYQQPFGGNLNAMPEYNGMYDDRAMVFYIYLGRLLCARY
jgi:hypothetical protein